jgi:hypothetical protein
MKHADIVNEVERAYLSNIDRLKIALATNAGGYVHVWPKYWIGVKFNNDVCHGVSVDAATVTHQRDKRVFTNGNHERTILMNRRDALQAAMESAVDNLAQWRASLAA